MLLGHITLNAFMAICAEGFREEPCKCKTGFLSNFKESQACRRGDQLRGLVVRFSDYEPRGPGFDSRLYHGNFPRRGRIPVVTMVWVVSRLRFKVETSFTKNQKSIKND